MVNEATYDQVVALVRLKAKVAVLLYLAEDPISVRALSGFSPFEGKLEALGFYVLSLAIDERSSHYEETSCVRVPQLRVFEKGHCKVKLTGLFSQEDLDPLITQRLS